MRIEKLSNSPVWQRLVAVMVLFTLMLVNASVEAAEGPSARAAQRISLILQSAIDDPEDTLERLGRLARNRGLSAVDRAYVAHERAVLLVQQDRAEQALEELSAVMAAQDESFLPQMRILLGQILLVAERPSEALEHFSIWYRNSEEHDPRQLVMMAYTQLQLERWEEATEVLEAALETAAEPEPAWYELLAFSYIKTERHREAEELLLDVIAERPLEAKWWRQLSTVNILMENLAGGAAAAVISQNLETLELNDAKRLVGLFTAINMPLDGALLWQTSLEREGTRSFEDQMLLAELWILAREFEPALESLEAAVALATDSEPLLKRAQLYLQREMYLQAGQELRRAIAMDTDDSREQAYYLLSVVEINLGNYAAAGEALRHIEESDDYGERAQQLNSFLDRQLAGAAEGS